jgi:hypothetical protein
MVTTWLLGMKLSPGGLEGIPAMGELLMGDVRYAVRVRGHSGDAVTVAGQSGLDVAIDPERTLLRGRLPDQAALFGILAKARLFGLEVIEVRRLRQGSGH